MRKIILDLAVSLDGFIEGPSGEVDWCIMDEEMNFDGFLSGIDTIFYGRKSYDQWGNYQPPANADTSEKDFWRNIHSRKKYVFTNNPAVVSGAACIGGNVEKEVLSLKRQEGKDIWLYGGASLIKTFIDLNLIDVYRLSVHPVALGKGKPLFENLSARLNLQLESVKQFSSGVVQLVYYFCSYEY
jgi:dihydrofolate reductase